MSVTPERKAELLAQLKELKRMQAELDAMPDDDESTPAAPKAKPMLETALERMDAPRKYGGDIRSGMTGEPQEAFFSPEAKKVRAWGEKQEGKYNADEMIIGEGAGIDPAVTAKALAWGIEKVASDPLMVAGGPLKLLSKGVKGSAKYVAALTEQAATKLSGKSADALRALRGGKGAEALTKAKENVVHIGNELEEMYKGSAAYFPEKAIIDASVKKMPPMSAAPVIAKLEAIKKKTDASTPLGVSMHKAIDEQIDLLTNPAKPTGLLDKAGKPIMSPATPKDLTSEEWLLMRRSVDQTIGKGWEPGQAKIYQAKLREMRRLVKEMLVSNAERAGVKEFAPNMRSWHDKMEIIDDLKLTNSNARALTHNLFSGEKSQQQEAFKALDKIFGKDFHGRAEMYAFAKEFSQRQLDVKGFLPELSGQGYLNTVGLSGGAAMAGGPVAAGSVAAPILALSTPAISSGVILTQDKIGKITAAISKAQVRGRVLSAVQLERIVQSALEDETPTVTPEQMKTGRKSQEEE